MWEKIKELGEWIVIGLLAFLMFAGTGLIFMILNPFFWITVMVLIIIKCS